MIGAVSWRRNLAALWLAEFMSIVAGSFALPFLSIFLAQDLNVRSGKDLYLWTAAAFAGFGIAMAIASPAWGAVADRYGRKPMVIRSMVAVAATVGLIYLVQNPWQLVFLRFLQGATTGTVPAAASLVTAETPRARVGWAIGLFLSSVTLGTAIGPLLGGLAASAIGLRLIFLAGGIVSLIAVVPVLLLVEESPRTRDSGPAISTKSTMEPAARRQVAAIIVLVTGFNLAGLAMQQLFVLRLLDMVTGGVTAFAGVGFALSGMANTGVCLLYTRLTRRFGYVATVAVAAGLGSVATCAVAIAPAPGLVVLAVALGGLFGGAVGPALTTMLGLAAQPDAHARVFGYGNSATALGFFLGPTLAGGAASLAGVQAAVLLMAALTGVLAAAVVALTREPVEVVESRSLAAPVETRA